MQKLSRKYIAILCLMNLGCSLSLMPLQPVLEEIPVSKSAKTEVPRIAFFYYTDDSDALIFETLLENWGYAVDLFDIFTSIETDLQQYQLIIIGEDTGQYYEWFGDDPFQIRRINVSVLGIGEGGACFFEEIGSPLRYGNTMGATNRRNFTHYLPDHPIYTDTHEIPNPIVGSDTNLEWRGSYIPRIEHLKEIEIVINDEKHQNHSILSIEAKHFGLWAIKNAPDVWSVDLEHLFANTLRYLIQEPSTMSPPSTVAYIYDTDLTAATEFYYMVGSFGFLPTLISLAELNTTHLEDFDLFMIGADTAIASDWTRQPYVEIIDAIQKPILGIERGGGAFFDDLSLNASYDGSSFSIGYNITIDNTSHVVFNEPNIFESSIISSSSFLSWMPMYKPFLDESVESFTTCEDKPNYTVMTVEDNQYGYWAILDSPGVWEADLQALFENFIHYLLTLPVPNRSQVAFIYDDQPSYSTGYEQMIESWGYRVTKVFLGEMTLYDWRSFDLVILGHDTGVSDVWDSPSEVLFLDNLQIPIFGIARGGSCFFTALNLNSSGGGLSYVGTNITGINLTHPIWSEYGDFDVNLTISAGASNWLGRNLNLLADHVETIFVDGVYSNYCLLTIEENKYLYWGYFNNPVHWNTNLTGIFHSSMKYLLDLFKPSESGNENLPPQNTDTTTDDTTTTENSLTTTDESDENPNPNASNRLIAGYPLTLITLSALITLGWLKSKKRTSPS